jgi:hypothetical protein
MVIFQQGAAGGIPRCLSCFVSTGVTHGMKSVLGRRMAKCISVYRLGLCFRQPWGGVAKQVCLMVCLWGLVFLNKGMSADWVLEGVAEWQPRDSHAEWVFGGRMWIGGGWFNSYEAPPRDVWYSETGNRWTKVTEDAPWIHSDLPMSLTFGGRMWIMGGWFKGRLPGHSAGREVWASRDGLKWDRVMDRAMCGSGG